MLDLVSDRLPLVMSVTPAPPPIKQGEVIQCNLHYNCREAVITAVVASINEDTHFVKCRIDQESLTQAAQTIGVPLYEINAMLEDRMVFWRRKEEP